MTNNNVNVSVPNEYLPLKRASEMLLNMANDCNADVKTKDTEDTPLAEIAPIPNGTGAPAPGGAPAPSDNGGSMGDLSEPGATPELDKAGYPWDERIHGATKKKTAKDGRWTKIKNLDKNKPGLFDEVIAELTLAGFGPQPEAAATGKDNVVDINQGGAPAPAPAPAQTAAPAPAPAPATTVKYVLSDGNHYTYDQLIAAGHTDALIETYDLAPAETVQTEATTTGATFPELMSLITPALANNTISQAQIDQALSVHGLTSLPLLSAQPQHVPAVKTALFG